MERRAYAHFDDVLDDNDFELIPKRFEEFTEVGRLALRADRAADREAVVEEGFDDPDGNVTVRAGHKDLA